MCGEGAEEGCGEKGELILDRLNSFIYCETWRSSLVLLIENGGSAGAEIEADPMRPTFHSRIKKHLSTAPIRKSTGQEKKPSDKTPTVLDENLGEHAMSFIRGAFFLEL